MQEPVALLAFAKRLRGMLALGDVVEDGGEARSLSATGGDPEMPLQRLKYVSNEQGSPLSVTLVYSASSRGLTSAVGLTRAGDPGPMPPSLRSAARRPD